MTDLFESLRADGKAAVDALVTNKQVEGIELDFKQKADASRPEAGNEDKRRLGEALSGFANSMGGVLFFGIDARKNADGIDCADCLAPITGVAQFADEVQRLIPQYTMPRLQQFEVLTIDAGDGSGFVAVHVGRSERRPHMSLAPGDRRYYRRSGDSFFVMEHFEIEDAFRRNAVPVLSVSSRITRAGSVGGVQQYQLVLSIRNDSAVTARFPYLAIEEVKHAIIDKWGLDGNGNHGLPRTKNGNTWWFSGGADHVIHPGVEWDITSILIEHDNREGGPETVNKIELEKFKLEITFSVGCEHARAIRGAIVHHGTELF